MHQKIHQKNASKKCIKKCIKQYIKKCIKKMRPFSWGCPFYEYMSLFHAFYINQREGYIRRKNGEKTPETVTKSSDRAQTLRTPPNLIARIQNMVLISSRD